MSTSSSDDIGELQDLIHKALAKEFLAQIKSGEASPSLLNAARQYLKDNGVTGLPVMGTPLATLTEALPFDCEPEDSDHDFH